MTFCFVSSLTNAHVFSLPNRVSGFFAAMMARRPHWNFLRSTKQGQICKKIESVALVHTSIQSDKRMQTKGDLSTSNSKQTQPQNCPGTRLNAYKESGRVNP